MLPKLRKHFVKGMEKHESRACTKHVYKLHCFLEEWLNGTCSVRVNGVMQEHFHSFKWFMVIFVFPPCSCAAFSWPFVQVLFPPRQKTLQSEQIQKVFKASQNSSWLEDEIAFDEISFNNVFHSWLFAAVGSSHERGIACTRFGVLAGRDGVAWNFDRFRLWIYFCTVSNQWSKDLDEQQTR